MTTAARDDHATGIEFITERDGTVTARDRETGLARGGDSRSDALRQLAEVLALEEGRGEPVTDGELREWGLDPDEFDDEPLPRFLR